MKKAFKYPCVVALALGVAGTAASSAGAPDPLAAVGLRGEAGRFQRAMFQYYSMPDWQFFENLLRRDAQFWMADRYLIGTLSRVDQVDGSLSSGTWSARGNFYYISGWDEKQYTGWIIFRFRNGYFDCVVYHNFPRTCRAPNG